MQALLATILFPGVLAEITIALLFLAMSTDAERARRTSKSASVDLFFSPRFHLGLLLPVRFLLAAILTFARLLETRRASGTRRVRTSWI